jgi:pimeloyl-ACP methyl ester carboxylesterase
MARHLRTRGCFLIGSVRSPRELPPRITMLRGARRALAHVPYELLCRTVGAGVILLGQYSGPATRSFLKQLSDSDAAFLRWATRAVLTWDPPQRSFDFPIHHIHGDRDRVLPSSHTRPDRLVAGAGHVLSLTHAREVTEFLRQRMTNDLEAP